MRRGLIAAVLLCLAGAALVLLATSRIWLSYEFGATPPLPGRRIDISGAMLAPGARALGLVGLAGVAALPATRTWGRLLVGALLALAGSGTVAVLVRVLADPAGAARRTEPLRSEVRLAETPDLGSWPYVAFLGALLLVVAGLLVVLRGRSWAALGTRYDAPTAPKPAGEASLWEALDRGDDPTAGPGADRTA